MSEEENKAVEENKVIEDQSQGGEDQTKVIAALKQEAAANRVMAKELKEKLGKIEAEKQAAIEEEAIKNGEAATLLEAQKAELATLTGKTAEYEGALQKYLDVELEGLSDELKALIPGGSIASQLEWVSKARTAGLLKARKIANGVMDSGEEKDNSGNFSAEIKAATTQKELDAIMKKYGRL